MALNPVNLETGAEQKAADFINRLEGFKKQSLNQVAETSQVRGTEQGMAAGKEYAEKRKTDEKAQVEFKSNFGVSNKAYNSTLKAAYKATAKSSLSEGLSALAAEHPDDLQTFNDLSQELIKSSIQNADPMLADELAIDADLVATQYRKQVQGNAIKLNLQGAKKAYEDANLALESELLRSVENARTPDELLASATQAQSLFAQLDEQVAGGGISPEQALSERARISKGFAEQTFMNQVDDSLDISPEAAIAKLEELEPTPKGWSPIEWDSFLAGAKSKVSRELASRGAVDRANKSRIANEVKLYYQAKSNGDLITAPEAKRLRKEAGAYPELIESMTMADNLGTFSLNTPQSQQAQIDTLLSEGTIESYGKSQKLSQQQALMNKKYSSDPIGTLSKQGIIEETDLSDENFFQIAGNNSLIASEHLGGAVPALTKAQAQYISSSIVNGTAADKAALLGDMESMTNGKMETYKQLAGEGAEVFAVAGSTGNFELAKEIFNLQEQVELKSLTMPKSSEYQAVSLSYLGNALGAKDKAAIEKTAAILVSKSYTESDRSFNSDDYENAIDKLVGGVGERNGGKFILPKYEGMLIDDSDFEDYIDDVSPGGYAAMGTAAGYSYEQFKEVLSDAKLVGVGDNQYMVIDNGRRLTKGDGTNFILKYDPSYVTYVKPEFIPFDKPVSGKFK